MGNFWKIFGLAMGIIYIAAGTMLIVSAGFFNLAPFQRILLGVIVIAYGLYRSYRVIKNYREEKEDEDNE